jgi:hypothetical protein
VDNRASAAQVVGRVDERGDEILTPALVEELQRRFGGRRDELFALGASAENQRRDLPGGGSGFLPETPDVRTSEWTVAQQKRPDFVLPMVRQSPSRHR